MLKITSKAAVVACGSLAVLGVASAAYAANLTMSSDSLGAGTTTVAACAAQSAAIKATWVPTVGTGAGFNDTVTGFTVNQVNLTGIPASCSGKTVFVSVHDGTAILGGGSVTIPAEGTPAAVTLVPKNSTTGIPAKSLIGINILVPN